MNLSGKLGAFLLCLFALPFAGFGLFALSQTARLAHFGHGSSSSWLPLVFGLVFSGIGFGLIFVVLAGGKLLQRQKRLEVEHPNEPWLWRKDWAEGRADSGPFCRAATGRTRKAMGIEGTHHTRQE